MQKRINMILEDDETEKLQVIKQVIGLKTTTDTIRYLISSVYMKMNEKPVVATSPYVNPFPYPMQPGFPPPSPYTQTQIPHT